MLIDGLNLTDTSNIENAIVASGASFPVGAIGEMFYRTDTSLLYVYDGASWNPAAPAASSSAYISASFPGAIGPLDSKARWSPPRTITLTNVAFNIDTPASSAPIVLDIKKNGTTIFAGAKPTLGIGVSKSDVAIADIQILTTDYITLDILSGDGSDMTVRIDYN